MISTAKSETVQFTTKGQVVIPARIRREFQIEEGTKASVVVAKRIAAIELTES